MKLGEAECGEDVLRTFVTGGPPVRGGLLGCCSHVTRQHQRFSDEYEQDVDEIIAACRGDLRGAVRALMLINEQLEQTLRQLSAVLIEKAGEVQPPLVLH